MDCTESQKKAKRRVLRKTQESHAKQSNPLPLICLWYASWPPRAPPYFECSLILLLDLIIIALIIIALIIIALIIILSAIAFLGHARKNTRKNAHKNALHYARHNQLENIDNLRTYTPLHSPLHFVHTLWRPSLFYSSSCNKHILYTHLTLQQNE